MKKSFGNRNGMYSPDAIAAECRDLLALAAGPRGWNDTRESWLARGARVLGLDQSRAKNIWYGKSRRIEASEYLTMKARADGLREAQSHEAIACAQARNRAAALGIRSTDELGDPSA